MEIKMIKVDNSAEKRVFHLTEKENEPDFIKLKNEIIESIKNKNYSKFRYLKREKNIQINFQFLFFMKKFKVEYQKSQIQ
ncbi:MAG: hypothetical protein U5K55_13290 [Aliarcobacter sp.]|nr:hypothetical protein [Aliarcobacter sp.]